MSVAVNLKRNSSICCKKCVSSLIKNKDITRVLFVLGYIDEKDTLLKDEIINDIVNKAEEEEIMLTIISCGIKNKNVYTEKNAQYFLRSKTNFFDTYIVDKSGDIFINFVKKLKNAINNREIHNNISFKSYFAPNSSWNHKMVVFAKDTEPVAILIQCCDIDNQYLPKGKPTYHFNVIVWQNSEVEDYLKEEGIFGEFIKCSGEEILKKLAEEIQYIKSDNGIKIFNEEEYFKEI